MNDTDDKRITLQEMQAMYDKCSKGGADPNYIIYWCPECGLVEVTASHHGCKHLEGLLSAVGTPTVCPACKDMRQHSKKEMKQYHPHAGEGKERD